MITPEIRDIDSISIVTIDRVNDHEKRVFNIIRDQQMTWCSDANNRRHPINALPQHAEADRWMNRVNWEKHLLPFDKQAIYELSLPVRETEQRLEKIVRSMIATLETSIEHSQSIDRSNSILFIVNRIDEKREKKPFNPHMQAATWKRYIGWIKKIIIVICRMEDAASPVKPAYTLTEKQKGSFSDVMNCQSDSGPSERECMNFLVSLADQEMVNGPYDCILLSAIAIVSLDETLRFATAKESTPLFAAILAIFRSLILSESHYLAVGSNRLVKETIELTNRCLMHPERHRNPGPISWILTAFAYAETIARDEGAPPRIIWHDDELSFGGNGRLSMTRLIASIQTGILSCRRSLYQLVHINPDTGSHRSELPTIHWSMLEDDLHNRHEFGYSFLKDERNCWVREKSDWVYERVLNSKSLRTKWLDASTMLVNPEQLESYERTLRSFLSQLLVLVHMTAGQPARGTEIMSIRYYNTRTKRNIFIDDGLVCIHTTYHKQFVQFDREKHVFRYLPEPVGELLVYYIWLVVPFYTKMRGFTLGFFDYSPYIWTENVVVDHSVPIGCDTQSLFWGTSHLTKFLKEFSNEHLGVEITTLLWRHIAIAIARKYLRSTGLMEYDKRGDEEFNEDPNDYTHKESSTDITPQNNIWDLQATHSTNTAERIYAIEHDRGYRIAMIFFRNISTVWHGFFIPGHGSKAAVKSGENTLHRDQTCLRRIRLRKLMNANLQYYLEFFMKSDVAEFRGNQFEAISAIIEGKSIILQITGTGVGKSLSFMLPAYMSPQGITIVIMPLVSLQNDLVERSIAQRVSAKAWSIRDAMSCLQTLVYVTPESACTQSFMNYVSFLQGYSLLDRIVVDECHTLLQCTNEFRRRMVDIKNIIQSTGVQVILLTATLPPSYESELFRTFDFHRQEVFIARSTTSRRNIRYCVRTIGSDNKSLINAIRQERCIEGKVIVYVRTIEQGEFVAKELDCPFFHSSIGTSSMKSKILSNFINTGSLIVATNAMGMGIDIPNIRLVINAGSPNSLMDFVQQSGRGGRDGMESVSMLLHQPKFSTDNDMKSYIFTKRCRRLIINTFMDGDGNASECIDGGVCCDICEKINFDAGAVDIDDVLPVATTNPYQKKRTTVNPYRSKSPQHCDAKRRCVATSVDVVINHEVRNRRNGLMRTQDNAVLLRTIKEMLDEFSAVKCMVCKLANAVSCLPEHQTVLREIEHNRERMINSFRSGSMLPSYCACRIPGCYIPQIWCKSYDKTLPPSERICKFKYVLLDLLYCLRSMSRVVTEAFDAMVDKSENQNEAQFLARESKVGRERCIQLVLVVHELLQMFKSLK